MIEPLLSLLRPLLTTLAFLLPADVGALTSLGVLGATVALGSVAVLAAAIATRGLLALALPAAGGSSPPHPRRAIPLSVPLPQSDPDAAGHPRPRAPGLAASAA